MFGEGDSSSLIHSIGREQLTARHGIWMLNHDADLSAWNGATVVAVGDWRADDDKAGHYSCSDFYRAHGVTASVGLSGYDSFCFRTAE